MFDLAQKRLVWIPIKWRGLLQKDPDAIAEPTEFEIEILAEILDEDDLRRTFSEPNDEMTPEQRALAEEAEKLTPLEKFKRVASDWRKVVSGGQPVPFTDENILLMLKQPNFAIGFDTSYMMAWAGRIALAEKNSGSSSDSGQPDAGEPGAKKTTRSSRRKRNS